MVISQEYSGIMIELPVNQSIRGGRENETGK